MPLSTFNSDAAHRVPPGRLVICFASTVVGLVASTSAVWQLSGLKQHEVLAAAAYRPPGPDYDLAANGHEVLFHGLDGTDEHFRRADVLFFGSSRSLVAFRRPLVRGFFQRYDLRYYNLSMSGGTDVFAKALVERFDLRAPIVIVDENSFFTGENTPMAERAMNDGYFDAVKRVAERRAGHAVKSRLHKVVPHLSGRDLPGIPNWMIYRSRSDGTWYFSAYKDMQGGPVHEPPRYQRSIPDAHFQAAEQFKQLLDRRGSRLILTFVPSAHNDRWRAVEIAEHLGVPLLSPQLEGLTTYDDSHLDRPSAARFTEAFLRELEQRVLAK